MTILRIFRSSEQAPPQNQPQAPEPSAIIELMYAGHAMAQYMCLPTESGFQCALCGHEFYPLTDSRSHADLCPVGRYYRAVNAVSGEVSCG